MRVVIGPIAMQVPLTQVLLGVENPGVGGTQFAAVGVAHRLANTGDLDVVLVCQGEKERFEDGLRVVPDLQVFNPLTDVLCIPSTSVGRLTPSTRAKIQEAHVVLWSHHPFDPNIRQWQSFFPRLTVLSVGQLQFYTNLGDWSSVWIPNPIPKSRDHAFDFKERDERLAGHIGALVAAKSFDRLVTQWLQFASRENSSWTLEVIGSDSLYSGRRELEFSETYPTSFPVSGPFGDRIKNIMQRFPDSCSTIKFLGLLDSGKYQIMERWTYAVQNLTGRSEAFPTSLMEVLNAGVIPIGSQRLGMYDVMQHFPETSVTRNRPLSSVLSQLHGSETLRQELRERVKDCRMYWSQQDALLEDRWRSLLSFVNDGVERHKPAKMDESLRPRPLTPRIQRRLRVEGSIRQMHRGVRKHLVS